MKTRKALQAILLIGSVLACACTQTATTRNSLARPPSTGSNQNGALPTKTPRHERTVVSKKAAALLNTSRGGMMPSPTASEIKGIGFFFVADIAFRKLFQALNISFPSQLGGCCILFTLLMLVNVLTCEHAANAMLAQVAPGAAWLTKWLPVFFVPGLAMLPLAPSVGSAVEIAKVLSLVILGFFGLVFVVGTTVEIVLNLQGGSAPTTAATPQAAAAPSAPKPAFSQEVLNMHLSSSLVYGVLSIAAQKNGNEWTTALKTGFTTSATVAGFVIGNRMPSHITKVIHPLLFSTAGAWIAAALYGTTTGEGFKSVLQGFKTGSLDMKTAGTGDLLLYMLGPAVVSFCVPIYSRKAVLQKNFFAVVSGVLAAALAGLFGAAAYARVLNFENDIIRISALPRFITTALAIPVTNMLGGNVPMAAALVVVTGIFAGTVGPATADFFGFKSPVSRGMSVGGAGNALGAAAMIPEPDAFPFAISAMILTAAAVTSLVAIPAVRDALLSVAVGK